MVDGLSAAVTRISYGSADYQHTSNASTTANPLLAYAGTSSNTDFTWSNTEFTWSCPHQYTTTDPWSIKYPWWDDYSSCEGSAGSTATTLYDPNFMWHHVQETTVWGQPHIWTPLQKNPDREKAKARAKELLVKHLTPNQRGEYEQHGCFHVVTRKKHRYLIKQGRISNVIRLNKRGKPVRAFCIHPKIFVPDEDTMLTQKLMLETDEDEFLRIANHRKVHTRAQLIPWNPEATRVA